MGWSPDRPTSRTRKCVTYKSMRLTDVWAGRETAHNCPRAATSAATGEAGFRVLRCNFRAPCVHISKSFWVAGLARVKTFQMVPSRSGWDGLKDFRQPRMRIS